MSNDTDKNVTMKRLNVTLVLLRNNVFKNNLIGAISIRESSKTHEILLPVAIAN